MYSVSVEQACYHIHTEKMEKSVNLKKVMREKLGKSLLRVVFYHVWTQISS